MAKEDHGFASRSGVKLDTALDAFALDVTGLHCADLGCNVGGFTDCLLQRGAEKVFAVDTGYGALAWKLRKDPRVVVMERTNALYCDPPETVDLVVIDVAWTPQERILPAAWRWLSSAGRGDFPCIVSLLKPHYEQAKQSPKRPRKPLEDSAARKICSDVCARINQCSPYHVSAVIQSVLRGKGGNLEFLLKISPDESAS